MRILVAATLAVVTTAAPVCVQVCSDLPASRVGVAYQAQSYAAPAVLPVIADAKIDSIKVDAKTIQLGDLGTAPITGNRGAFAYSYGVLATGLAPAVSVAYSAPAAVSVKAQAPVDLKTIKVDSIKPVPFSLNRAAFSYSTGFAAAAPAITYTAPAAIAVKATAPVQLKTIKVGSIKPVPFSLNRAAFSYSTGFAAAAPAITYTAPAAVAVKAAVPIELKTVKVDEVKAALAPVAYAAPAVAYAAPAAVAVKIAPVVTYAAAPTVIRHEVEIPITKTVHYADRPVVTGYTTTIHKPTIFAPPIAAPRTLIGKTITNPATLSVSKYAAEVKTINHVPQPYAVPYDVPVPYAVPTPVHTAPIHIKKRVYAAPAIAPVVYAAPAVTVGTSVLSRLGYAAQSNLCTLNCKSVTPAGQFKSSVAYSAPAVEVKSSALLSAPAVELKPALGYAGFPRGCVRLYSCLSASLRKANDGAAKTASS